MQHLSNAQPGPPPSPPNQKKGGLAYANKTGFRCRGYRGSAVDTLGVRFQYVGKSK